MTTFETPPAHVPAQADPGEAALVVRGPAAVEGLRFPLPEDDVVVGRDGADVVLPLDGVSRRHARIRRRGIHVWVEDLGSRRGTTIGGRPVHGQAAAHDGDVLAFGPVTAVLSVPATSPGLPRPLVPEQRQDERRDAAARSDTTRYLAATTYLDERFCDHVIDVVVEEPFRALAPTFGADVTVVARHALAARRLRLLTDAALAVVTVATLAVFVLGLPRDAFAAWWAAPTPASAGQALRSVPWAALAPGAVLAALAVGAHSFAVRHLVLAARLRPGRFRPQDAPPVRGERVEQRLDDVRRREEGNVTVFSSFLPFAGSGEAVDSGQLAVDVSAGPVGPGGGRREPLPFTAAELHAALVTELRAVGLPNLHAEHRLFVHGQDAWRFEALLPDRLRPPVAVVSPDYIAWLTSAPQSPARGYVAVEISGWGGQLVATTYVRAVRVRGALYLDWVLFALRPLRPEFLAVDQQSRSAAGWLAFAAGEALTSTWWRAPAAPVRLLREANRWRARRARRAGQERQIRDGGVFDYGARAGLREIAAGDDERRYFLHRDLLMYGAVTKERVFTVVERFLEEHGVDTGAFPAAKDLDARGHARPW